MTVERPQNTLKDIGDSEQLRIVHVADYVMPQMGYQEFMLAKWNARHGHDVHMITSDRYTPVPDYDLSWRPILGDRYVGPGVETIEGVTLHRLEAAREVLRRIWLKDFEKTILDIEPSVVFCHGTASPLAFSLPKICSRAGIPLVLDNHMAYVAQRGGVLGNIYYGGLRLLTRRILNERVDLFLGVSEESCEFMITQQGIPEGKVDLLEIGVDTSLFSPDESAGKRAREKYGIAEGAQVVIQTGKLTPDKSPHWLSEAMAKVMKERDNVWLMFTGGAEDAYHRRIVEPIESASAADRLKFIPMVPVSELPSLYSMADLCVFPDASSLSSIEAAACARPVIVTDLPWGKEREEVGAVLCYRTGDTENLAIKIGGLLADSKLRETLGARAREVVVEKYSYDAVALKSERLMRDLVMKARA